MNKRFVELEHSFKRRNDRMTGRVQALELWKGDMDAKTEDVGDDEGDDGLDHEKLEAEDAAEEAPKAELIKPRRAIYKTLAPWAQPAAAAAAVAEEATEEAEEEAAEEAEEEAAAEEAEEEAAEEEAEEVEEELKWGTHDERVLGQLVALQKRGIFVDHDEVLKMQARRMKVMAALGGDSDKEPFKP